MSITDEKKQKIFDKYGGRCAYCGRIISIKRMTIDHIVPKSGEGDNGIDNLNPSCKPCNTLKGSMSLQEFTALTAELMEKGKYKFDYPPGKKKKTQFYFTYVKENNIEIKPAAQPKAKPKAVTAAKAKAPATQSAKTKQVESNTIKIPKSLHQKLAKEAAKEGVTVDQWVVYKLSV